MFHRAVLLPLVAMGVLMVYGCGGPSPVSPSPVTPPPPSPPIPSPQPRALAGTVFETPPTQQAPVPGARVQVVTGSNAGANTTTDGSGRYTLPAMEGEFDIQVSRQGFTTRTVHLNMADRDPPSDIQLGPEPRIITETFVASSVSPSPHVFSTMLQIHNAGEIVITDWDAYGFEEGDLAELEIWEGGQRFAGTVIERSFPRHTVVLRVAVPPGRTYEVRGHTYYWWNTITLTHPN